MTRRFPLLRLLAFIATAVALRSSAHAQAPANDRFVNRTQLTAALPITVNGTCVGATIDAGEPDHADFDADNLASNSVWFRWTSTVTGAVSFTVSETNFDHVIAVYTGTAMNNLNEVGSADEYINAGERTAINAVVGVSYSIAVDGYSTARGSVQAAGAFRLQIAFVPQPENDDFADALVLVGPLPTGANGTTFGATVEPSEPDHANAVFDNLASNSVWYQWTPTVSQVVIASCLGADIDGVLAVYTGTLAGGLRTVGVSDGYGPAGIEAVTFAATAGITYSIAVDAYSGDGLPAGGWPFVVTVSLPPANDQFVARQDLGNALPIIDVDGSCIGATAQAGEPEHANAAGGNQASSSVWFQWTAPRAARVGVDVESELMDSIVAVYTGTSLGSLVEVASEDLSSDGIQKRAVFHALAGTTYLIAIDGYSNDDTRTTASEDLFYLSIREVPANDDLAAATDLLDLPVPLLRRGTTLGASGEFLRGEPDHAFDIGDNLTSNSVWYLWRTTATAEVEVRLRDLAFDGVLAVYARAAEFELTEVASADAIGAGVEESLTFTPVAGQIYAIAVDVYSQTARDAGGGPFTLTIGGDPGPGDPYGTWIAGFPSLSGDDALPGASPAGDGVTNLIKLVLGLNPTLPLASDPLRGNFPSLRSYNGHPAIEYVVDPDNLGTGPGMIRHGGEVSAVDLDSWVEVGAVDLGDNTWLIELDDDADAAQARFGRLKASIPIP